MQKLSKQESWAWTLRAAGVQGKEAAQVMDISLHTYRAHLRHALELLRVLSPNHSFQATLQVMSEELDRVRIEEVVRIMVEERLAAEKVKNAKKAKAVGLKSD